MLNSACAVKIRIISYVNVTNFLFNSLHKLLLQIQLFKQSQEVRERSLDKLKKE